MFSKDNVSYRLLFEGSADAMLIIDGEKFIDCNQATLDMLGMESHEKLFSTHPSKLSPEYQYDGRSSFEKANEMIAIAKEKGSNRFEWIHTRSNGNNFPVEVLLTHIPYEGRGLLHLVWRDITERKNNEKALKKAHLNLEQIVVERTKQLEETTLENQLILESAGEGIFGLDLKGQITFANPAAQKMLGFSLQEMLNHAPHSLIHHTKANGETYPIEECSVYTALREGISNREVGEVFWKKDGTSFPVEFISTPIKEKDKIVGAVVIFSDISERLENESLLQQYSTELENSNKELMRFASITSHDLKNPIRKIINFCSFIEEEGEGLPENIREYVNSIELAANHSERVNDFETLKCI
jgi:PAS domain S-box-containing protein